MASEHIIPVPNSREDVMEKGPYVAKAWLPKCLQRQAKERVLWTEAMLEHAYPPTRYHLGDRWAACITSKNLASTFPFSYQITFDDPPQFQEAAARWLGLKSLLGGLSEPMFLWDTVLAIECLKCKQARPLPLCAWAFGLMNVPGLR